MFGLNPAFLKFSQKGHMWIYKAPQYLKSCVFLRPTSIQRQKDTKKAAFVPGKKVSSAVTPRTKVLFFLFLIICLYQAGLWLVLGDKRVHKGRRRNKTSNRNVEN